MLKTTLNINNNINIKKYEKLTAFLKRQSQGFQSKKSKVLTSEQIKKFLDEAPDEKYLATKIATIFGICGACRRQELCRLTINDIEEQSILMIKIPKTKNYKPKSFVVSEEFYNIYKKYAALRPKKTETTRFFLNYQNGKCTQQPIGINKFGAMPTIIASYLNLPNHKSYTGHTFRRTSATLLADAEADILTLKQHGGWKSNTVAEGYVENSLSKKKKISEQITNSITTNSSTSTTNFNINPSTSNAENIITTNIKTANKIN